MCTPGGAHSFGAGAAPATARRADADTRHRRPSARRILRRYRAPRRDARPTCVASKVPFRTDGAPEISRPPLHAQGGLRRRPVSRLGSPVIYTSTSMMCRIVTASSCAATKASLTDPLSMMNAPSTISSKVLNLCCYEVRPVQVRNDISTNVS